jgi:glycosyltransferase involved in cell wall biosynthesis
LNKPFAVVLFEPDSDGHQMDFVWNLVDQINKNVENVRFILITTQTAAAHPNCQRVLSAFRDLMDVRIAPENLPRNAVLAKISHFYERQRIQSEQLSTVLAEIGDDEIGFVILPHLEAIGLQQLAIRPRQFRGKPWATIAVGLRFHHRLSGIEGPFRLRDTLQRWLFNRVIRNPSLVCFGSVNPFLSRVCKNPKVMWCPEPASPPDPTDPLVARQDYGIRPETCVILVFGFIDRRKCVGLLLEAVCRMDPELDVTVVLAGTQHAGHLRPVLEGPAAVALRARGRLIEFNRYIMTGRDIDPLNLSDITWVYYDKDFVNTGSVLVRSAQAGKAVVCRRQGVMGRLVDESGCGATLGSEEPEVIAEALTLLVKDPALRRTMGQKGAAAFARNTFEAFARPIVQAIQRVMPGS